MRILFPGDIESILVLSALFGIVVYWFWRLATAWKRVRVEQSVIDRLSDQEAQESMTEYQQEAMSGEVEEPAQLVERLLDQYSFPQDSAVLEHVQSISEAGIEGARLEVRQRLSSVSEEIFRDNARLKAILSIFIVIGLLGTLYGLADALATLSSDDLLNFEPSIVRNLLGRLETALAPSIWGVFTTIVGVLTYGYYLNAVCHPVQQELERATLDQWVPALYPTRSQRAKETLEEAREQLQDNVEAAERVAQFAERVDDDLQNFDERIASAEAFLDTFGASVERLTETTDGVHEAMSQVKDFQEKIEARYEQIANRQETLTALVRSLGNRDERVEERLDGLETLEREWRDHLSETQSQLQEVGSAARSTLQSLETRNEAVIEALREPIVEELNAVAERLGHLDESMHGGLQQVEQSLNRLESPVSNSADRIERIANTFSDSLHNAVTGVRDEFQRQNDTQVEKKDELERLNENIERLIEQQESVRESLKNEESDKKESGLFRKFGNYVSQG